MKWILAFSFLVLSACASKPKAPPPEVKTESGSTKSGYDAELTSFDYPYPVQYFSFQSQGLPVKMAYMDIAPAGGTEKVVVLLHGKNFSGYYFEDMIKVLAGKGYRVVVIDQIGFGKSSKPEHYQYSLQGLAMNTKSLLDSLQLKQYRLLGHSMGGMLATRFALMYPEAVSRLFLIDPIGLEDWKTMTPYKNVDQLYQIELSSNIEKVKQYQLDNYYGGVWKPEYDKYLKPAQGWFDGPDYPRIAMSSALTSEALFTQPVVYEFKNLKMPTVLVVGTKDRTALGKGWATDEMKKKMGNYPLLGKQVAKMIPGAKLITLEGLGHTPFIEAPEVFWKQLGPLF